MTHKTFSFLLAMLMSMVAGVASGHDFAVNGICYDITSSTAPYTASVTYRGDNYYIYSNEYKGSVTIPESVYYNGKTYSVTSIGSYAFRDCSSLTSVEIPYSVTSIGGLAFWGCSGLTSLTIPNSVTSIGMYAFSGCSGLTSVVIPNSVTWIGSSAFSGCSGLTSIVVENGNTKYDSRNGCNAIIETASNTLIAGCKNTIIPNSVTSIGDEAFSGCTGLTSIEIGNSVTSIGKYAFEYCSGLTSVTIGNSVTSIGKGAFSGCPGLTSIEIPNSVTSIGSSTFSGCSGLTSITIPESVTSIGDEAFSGCTGLTSIEIGNSVTSIGKEAFSGCTGITELTIADGEGTLELGYNSYSSGTGEGLFYDCPLEKLYLGRNISYQNGKSYGYSPFYGISTLTSVTINSNAIASKTYTSSARLSEIFGSQVTSYAFGESVEKIGDYACYNLPNITALSLPETLTSIGDRAFYGCTGLTSVEIPNSVTSIGSDAFRNCTGLTSVTIGNSVTVIGGGAFAGCSGLTSIEIPNSVTSIGYQAFYGCTGLKSVDIGNSVTTIGEGAFSGTAWYSNRPDGIVYAGKVAYKYKGTMPEGTEIVLEEGTLSITASAFYGCTGLTSVVIPNSVTSIGSGAFRGCTGLTSIEIPNSVTSIGIYAFSGCSGLTSVTINSNAIASKTYTSSSCLSGLFGSQVTSYVFGESVEKIGDYACYNLPNITNLSLPETLTSIGAYTFYGCSGLTSVEIPNSVTSIGDYVFSGCSGLTSIEIPNSVTSIGSSAFSGCTGLTSVEIPNSVTKIGEYAFEYCSGLTSVTIGNSVTLIGYRAFSDCTGLTSVEIPNSVTEIGESAFAHCSGLTSVEIPNSVTTIGEGAFRGCSGLTSVTINSNAIASKTYTSSSRLSEIFGSQVTDYSFGDGVETIGENACYGLTNLKSVNIGNSVTSIGSAAFSGCSGLTSVSLDCPTIGTWFSGLKGIQQLTIGDNVETINASAFSGCTNMSEAVMGDNVKSVGANAFPTSTALNVNRGTTSLLALWNANYLAPTEKGTDNVLSASTLKLDGTTQMTVTVSVNDFYPEYENTLNNNIIDEAVNVFTTQPELESTVTLRVTKDAVTYTAPNLTYTTLSISPTAARTQGTASSMAVKASYLEGDAQVTSQTLTVNGVTVEGDSLYLNGLKPNTTYKATYTIKVDDEYEYTGTVNLQTDALNFVNEQPKVISEGNVIIGATSNLDWEETNVGFQWRRTDWTDDFASNEAGAYQFEGKIEGYIRNMNTTYLWKFRPYYEAADGTRFYGNWLGIDPTNTSYFEPTVHTYANITVEGNSAEVKGYAQRGTDNVVSQGFVYWKASPQPSPVGREKAPAIPSGAQKVEASGTVMEANLTGLEYETTYSYVAYVTTSEGETFYGEEKMFTTGENPDGIEAVDNGQLTMDNAKGVYDLSGRRINVNVNNSKFEIQNSKLRKGIYIVNGKKLLKR